MAENFFLFLNTVAKSFNGMFGFVFSLIMIISAFIIDLLLSIVNYDYDKKKRRWYIIFCAGVIITEIAFNLRLLKEPFFVLFNLGVSVFLYSVIWLIPVKEKKSEEMQKEVIRFIDNKKAECEKEVKEERIICKKEEERGSLSDINFSHVKTVLNRLDGLGLSSVDKKTVQKLRENLTMAEEGDETGEVKEKINDGLSALLKIMSKYGA